MSLVLPAWPLFSAFLLMSFVLAVTPGPGVLYIVTRSVSQGRTVGLISVAGVALGNLMNAVGASIGLAAVFATSATAFLIAKYLGASYLVYLGVSAWLRPSADSVQRSIAAREKSVFRDGLIVALFNPKTAIFFAAFLPQFVNLSGMVLFQTLILSLIFVLIAAFTDSGYAILAAILIKPLSSKSRSVQLVGRYVSGALYVGLGILAASGGTISIGAQP